LGSTLLRISGRPYIRPVSYLQIPYLQIRKRIAYREGTKNEMVNFDGIKVFNYDFYSDVFFGRRL
jgi:hypothetical protein